MWTFIVYSADNSLPNVICNIDLFDLYTYRSEEYCLNERLVFGILFGAWLVSAVFYIDI